MLTAVCKWDWMQVLSLFQDQVKQMHWVKDSKESKIFLKNIKFGQQEVKFKTSNKVNDLHGDFCQVRKSKTIF